MVSVARTLWLVFCGTDLIVGILLHDAVSRDRSEPRRFFEVVIFTKLGKLPVFICPKDRFARQSPDSV